MSIEVKNPLSFVEVSSKIIFSNRYSQEQVKNMRDNVEEFLQLDENFEMMSAGYLKNSIALMVYSSNYCENAGLEMHETYKIIMKLMNGEENLNKDSDRIKSKKHERSHREVVQHYKAYVYLMEQETLNLETIKKCHSILMEDIEDEQGEFHGGEYRKDSCYGSDWIFPDYNNIPGLMEGFQKEVDKLLPQCNSQNMIVIAAHLSCYFVTVHPFTDGNGRISRLIMNYVLKKGGFPIPITLSLNKSKPRKAYYEAIEKGFKMGSSVTLPVLILSSMHKSIENWKQFSFKKLNFPPIELSKTIEEILDCNQ